MEIVQGKEATILFDAKRCIHSRQCVLGRPDVFVPNVDGEWIHPDAATKEEIAALALSCPSGAIRYAWIDKETGESTQPEMAPVVNVARVRENGPLAIHADIEVEGHGAMYRATLCRCGASQNKPFCDGSHATAAFLATGEVPLQESAPPKNRNGKLKISTAQNGPLIIEGNLEIVTGTGKTTNRVEKTAFCRCGGSASKPYCDGTHAKNGFRS